MPRKQTASLLAAVIPLFNVLAVISLSVFNENGKKPSVKGILLGILKNPLIIGIAAGVVAFAAKTAFGNMGIDFRIENVGWLYTVLDYLSRADAQLDARGDPRDEKDPQRGRSRVDFNTRSGIFC